jgi:hypothetical protein
MHPHDTDLKQIKTAFERDAPLNTDDLVSEILEVLRLRFLRYSAEVVELRAEIKRLRESAAERGKRADDAEVEIDRLRDEIFESIYLLREKPDSTLEVADRLEAVLGQR